MNCIICKKALRNLEEPDGNHPVEGIAFQSQGHYGSSAFDPMDGTYLEINICDPCLVVAGASGMVLIGFPPPARTRGPMMSWPLKTIEKEQFDVNPTVEK